MKPTSRRLFALSTGTFLIAGCAAPGASVKGSPFLNDGSVVFATIQANLRASTLSQVAPLNQISALSQVSPLKPGRGPALRVSAVGRRRVAAVATAVQPATSSTTPRTVLAVANLTEAPQPTDDGSTLFQYTFTDPDGAYGWLNANQQNPGGASASQIDLPTASILDWQASTYAGTASLPPGVPATASAYAYRVAIKVSSQAYTGSYAYVMTYDGDAYLGAQTNFDQVLDANGDPVVYSATDFAAPATGPATTGDASQNRQVVPPGTATASATSMLPDGSSYLETVVQDPTTHQEVSTGVYRAPGGTNVSYQLRRDNAKGTTTDRAAFPDGTVLVATFSAENRFTGGTLQDPTGRTLATVVLRPDHHLEIDLVGGWRMVAPKALPAP